MRKDLFSQEFRFVKLRQCNIRQFYEPCYKTFLLTNNVTFSTVACNAYVMLARKRCVSIK